VRTGIASVYDGDGTITVLDFGDRLVGSGRHGRVKETVRAGACATSSQDEICVVVDGGHMARLGFPIVQIILDDANGINPVQVVISFPLVGRKLERTIGSVFSVLESPR
jgi:hypothetical protein